MSAFFSSLRRIREALFASFAVMAKNHLFLIVEGFLYTFYSCLHSTSSSSIFCFPILFLQPLLLSRWRRLRSPSTPVKVAQSLPSWMAPTSQTSQSGPSSRRSRSSRSSSPPPPPPPTGCSPSGSMRSATTSWSPAAKATSTYGA